MATAAESDAPDGNSPTHQSHFSNHRFPSDDDVAFALGVAWTVVEAA